MRMEKALMWLLAFLLITVIWLGNFVFALSSFHYSAEFQKLGVNETVGFNVVNFVNLRGELEGYFDVREVSHLQDVRAVFSAVRTIYYSSLLLLAATVIYVFATKRFNHAIPRAFIISGFLSLLLLLSFFIFSLNFSFLFSIIHRPFFAGGSWVFPPDSLLIKAFPEQFFRDFTFNLIRLIFVNAALFFGIGLLVKKKFKREQAGNKA